MRSRISQWAGYVPRIAALEEPLTQQSDFDLKKTSLSLRYRARSGEPLDRLLLEAFALVREAGRRRLNMRHFDVQMLGGIGRASPLHRRDANRRRQDAHRHAAAVSRRAGRQGRAPGHGQRLPGPPRRRVDAADLRSAGHDGRRASRAQMPQPERRKAYACDITYGTAKEFGFDFLRDRLLMRRIGEGQRDLFGGMLGRAGEPGGDKPVQRELHFMLVDEADSILIDEARTPLIISALPGEERRDRGRSLSLGRRGRAAVRRGRALRVRPQRQDGRADADGRQLRPRAAQARRHGPHAACSTIYEYIERAIKVDREFFLDRQYVVRDGEIVIVDEFTGRLAEGRKWRAGIHQAVEAKEGVEVTVATGQAARITVQDFFLRYKHLAGMTGTASSSAPASCARSTRCHVVPMPTNRPPIRAAAARRWSSAPPTRNGRRSSTKCVEHARHGPAGADRHAVDRQVGAALAAAAASAASSTRCSTPSTSPQEAEIVAEAGQRGKVTVATNMAGRGTDIKLGDGVAELGGLHVICTELHESQRIDRQLIGRCGRQGDPGTYRQFLALDDEILLTGFGPKKAKQLKAARRAARRPRPAQRLRIAVPQGPAQGRTPPLPRPQGAALPRKGAPEDAAADGPGSVSGHAGIARYDAAACVPLAASCSTSGEWQLMRISCFRLQRRTITHLNAGVLLCGSRCG